MGFWVSALVQDYVWRGHVLSPHMRMAGGSVYLRFVVVWVSSEREGGCCGFVAVSCGGADAERGGAGVVGLWGVCGGGVRLRGAVLWRAVWLSRVLGAICGRGGGGFGGVRGRAGAGLFRWVLCRSSVSFLPCERARFGDGVVWGLRVFWLSMLFVGVAGWSGVAGAGRGVLLRSVGWAFNFFPLCLFFCLLLLLGLSGCLLYRGGRAFTVGSCCSGVVCGLCIALAGVFLLRAQGVYCCVGSADIFGL